jgi:hypothetical protein
MRIEEKCSKFCWSRSRTFYITGHRIVMNFISGTGYFTGSGNVTVHMNIYMHGMYII